MESVTERWPCSQRWAPPNRPPPIVDSVVPRALAGLIFTHGQPVEKPPPFSPLVLTLSCSPLCFCTLPVHLRRHSNQWTTPPSFVEGVATPSSSSHRSHHRVELHPWPLLPSWATVVDHRASTSSRPTDRTTSFLVILCCFPTPGSTPTATGLSHRRQLPHRRLPCHRQAASVSLCHPNHLPSTHYGTSFLSSYSCSATLPPIGRNPPVKRRGGGGGGFSPASVVVGQKA
jgi:hypothetical protein